MRLRGGIIEPIHDTDPDGRDDSTKAHGKGDKEPNTSSRLDFVTSTKAKALQVRPADCVDPVFGSNK